MYKWHAKLGPLVYFMLLLNIVLGTTAAIWGTHKGVGIALIVRACVGLVICSQRRCYADSHSQDAWCADLGASVDGRCPCIVAIWAPHLPTWYQHGVVRETIALYAIEHRFRGGAVVESGHRQQKVGLFHRIITSCLVATLPHVCVTRTSACSRATMDVQHPRAIRRVAVLAPSAAKRGLLLVLLAGAYSVALLWAYNTMGEPYAAAQAQAAAIAEAANKAEREALVAAGGVVESEWTIPGDTFGDEDGDSDMIDADVFDDGGMPFGDANEDGHGEEGDEDEDEADIHGEDDDAEDTPADEVVTTDATPSDRRTEASIDVDAGDLPLNEHGEVDFELYPELDPNLDLPPLPTPEEEAASRPLPSPYLPNAWASAFLFAVICCHVLFHLLCRWIKWFEASALYGSASTVQPGCSALVVPHAHRGRAAICRVRTLQGSASTSLRCGFEFQRQLYEFLTAEEVAAEPATAAARQAGTGEASADDANSNTADDGALVGLGSANGGVRPIKCPITEPLASYVSSTGISQDDVESLVAVYGKNVLTIPTPKFFDLYKEQLLAPLAIFQFFCAVLWMLDEYWQYTLFTFGSSTWQLVPSVLPCLRWRC